MTLFKKLKTASRTTKRKLTHAYDVTQATKRKVVNSKLYQDVGRASRSVEYALKNPAQEINTPQARRFRQKSNELGNIMFGDRMNRR